MGEEKCKMKGEGEEKKQKATCGRRVLFLFCTRSAWLGFWCVLRGFMDDFVTEREKEEGEEDGEKKQMMKEEEETKKTKDKMRETQVLFCIAE